MQTQHMQTQHMKKWTRPIGAEWPDHYILLGQNRDSDCLDRSNFRVALATLEKLPPFTPPQVEDCDNEPESRFVVRESHWACGWLEWIAIHESDAEGIKAGEAMRAKLEDYPILDEEDFSNLENEEADQVWRDCYSPKERLAYVRKHRSQFDSFHSMAELMACIRGKWFGGYASELIS